MEELRERLRANFKGILFSVLSPEKWRACVLTDGELESLSEMIVSSFIHNCPQPPQAEEAKRETVEEWEKVGFDTPWPLKDVLAKLIEAADILLQDRAYDGDGYELIQHAWEKGKEYLDAKSEPKE